MLLNEESFLKASVSFALLLADTGLFFTPNPRSSFFKPLEQLIFQYLSLETLIHHG